MDPMHRFLSEALQWSNVWVALAWLAVGVYVGWSRGIAATFFVAVLAAAVPTLLTLSDVGRGPSFRLLPLGSDWLVYVSTVALPMLACVVGGHIAVAVNPRTGRARATAVAMESARVRAEQIENELNELVGTAGLPYASTVYFSTLRSTIATKQAELRELQREIEPEVHHTATTAELRRRLHLGHAAPVA